MNNKINLKKATQINHNFLLLKIKKKRDRKTGLLQLNSKDLLLSLDIPFKIKDKKKKSLQ